MLADGGAVLVGRLAPDGGFATRAHAVREAAAKGDLLARHALGKVGRVDVHGDGPNGIEAVEV